MTASKFGRTFAAVTASLALLFGLSACGTPHETTEEDRSMTAMSLVFEHSFDDAFFVEDVNKVFSGDYTVYTVVKWGCYIDVKFDGKGNYSYVDEKKFKKALEEKSKEAEKAGVGEKVDVDVNNFVVHGEYFMNNIYAIDANLCETS